MMNLNETDARALDMLLDPTAGFPVEPAATGAPGGIAPGPYNSAADFLQSAGAISAVSDMSDELSSRISHVDGILHLLDYLPAEEPPPTLMERTLQRINESRLQSAVPPNPAQLNVSPLTRPAAGFNPGIVRSPSPADGDSATA